MIQMNHWRLIVLPDRQVIGKDKSKSYGVTFLESMPRLCDLVSTPDGVGDRVIDFLREDPSRTRAGRA